MTDAEISKAVALAIGYAPESVQIRHPGNTSYCYVYRDTTPWKELNWRIFQYTTPDVALPLLRWLSQPYGLVELWPNEESWTVVVHGRSMMGDLEKRINADTLELAIARAVIAVGRGS